MSISRKLFFILAAFAIVPAILFSSWIYTNARAALSASRAAELNALADLKRDQIIAYFTERKTDLLAATELNSVRRSLTELALPAADRDSARTASALLDIDRDLQPMRERYRYVDIMLTDPQGIVVYAIDDRLGRPLLGQPYPDRALLERAAAGFALAEEATPHGVQGQAAVDVAAPVRTAEGRTIGNIVASLDLGQTYDLVLNRTGLGETGDIVIAQREGDAARLIFPTRFDPAAAMSRRIAFGNVQGTAIQLAVSGRDGSGFTNDYRGAGVVAAWRYLPEVRWGLVTKIDAAEVFAPIDRLRNLAIAFACALVLIGFLAASLTARSITNPIRVLQRGTELIANGDLDHDVGTTARDEIGQFSRAFATMTRQLKHKAEEQERTAGELQRSREELEVRVQQRTSELRQTNEELAAANQTQQRTQAVLAEQTEILEAFFAHTQTCVVFLDPQFNFIRVNQAYARSCARNVEDFPGRNHFDLYPSSMIEDFRRVVESRRPWSATSRLFLFPDHPEWGETYWDLTLAPIVDQEGRVDYLVFSLNDVTQRVRDLQEIQRAEEKLRAAHDDLEVRVRERTADLNLANQLLKREVADRQRAEAELARLVRELENANGELSDFAHVVSHDLKAPLRAISTLASMLAQDYRAQFDAAGREQIDLLISRVRRMYSLVDGILAYSRLGRSPEERTDVDLNEVATHAVDLIAPPANIEVRIESVLPSLVCDRTRMLQVFQNLVGNAIKFMDKPQGVVRIGNASHNGELKLYVADNGPGIEERHFDRIFKVFQTLQSRDEFESTGIGLAIVKKIVEAYEGHIWLESTIGEGTTFYFTLRSGSAET